MAKVKPFIIGTHNSKDMLHAGAAILKRGGSAIDAVEASTKLVEANPLDTSVGLGGIPNLFGRHEHEGPQTRPRLRQARPARSGVGHRQAEIRQLCGAVSRPTRFLVPSNEDVLGFDVAVNDGLCVDEGEPVERLTDQRHSLGRL